MYLVAYQHLPYGRAGEMLGDWIGAPLSTGTLTAFMTRGAEDLQGFLEEIHAQVTAAPAAHFDETGARVAGRLRWLFCASTSRATYYSLHGQRGFQGLDHAGVLPHFTGIAVHDGFKPYRRYTKRALEKARCSRADAYAEFASDLRCPQAIRAVDVPRAGVFDEARCTCNCSGNVASNPIDCLG